MLDKVFDLQAKCTILIIVLNIISYFVWVGRDSGAGYQARKALSLIKYNAASLVDILRQDAFNTYIRINWIKAWSVYIMYCALDGSVNPMLKWILQDKPDVIISQRA